jgi:hypothetical protein
MSSDGYQNLNNEGSPKWWVQVRDSVNVFFNDNIVRKSFFRASPNKLVTASSLNHRYSRRYLKYSALALAVYFIIGLGYYVGHLKYSFLDSIYFIVVTFLTIG